MGMKAPFCALRWKLLAFFYGVLSGVRLMLLTRLSFNEGRTNSVKYRPEPALEKAILLGHVEVRRFYGIPVVFEHCDQVLVL